MSNIIMEVINASLYVSIFILLIITLKDKFLNKYTAIFRYILCIGIAIRGIFIFKINIVMPKFLEHLITPKDNIFNYNSTMLKNGLHIEILKVLFCIWFIGAIIKSINYINYNFKLYKKIKKLKLEVMDDNIHKILNGSITNFRIKKKMKIYKMNGIYSPMLMGIINPIIIIPNRDYSESELNYIFRHELIHYKRKDNIFKLILIIFNIIHWFNPLTRLFSKYFNEQCELSCDELVIRELSLDDIKGYSMLLLNTMKYKNKLESSICVSYLSSSKSNIIKDRIEGMFRTSKLKKGRGFILILFLILFASVTSIDNSVYANNKNTETNIQDPLDSGYVREMVDKHGHYQVTVGKSVYSFSKSNSVK